MHTAKNVLINLCTLKFGLVKVNVHLYTSNDSQLTKTHTNIKIVIVALAAALSFKICHAFA